MRLTSLPQSARSRFYFSILTLTLSLVLIAAPFAGVSASEHDARSDSEAEIYDDDPVVLPGGVDPDDVDHLDGEDGDPIDVDYITVLQLFLSALRTLR